MTWQEAIEQLPDDPVKDRYRWLCSDDNLDVASRDGYQELVIRLAEGTLEPIVQAPPREDDWTPPIYVPCCGGSFYPD